MFVGPTVETQTAEQISIIFHFSVSNFSKHDIVCRISNQEWRVRGNQNIFGGLDTDSVIIFGLITLSLGISVEFRVLNIPSTTGSHR